jgi:hypothetical protein
MTELSAIPPKYNPAFALTRNNRVRRRGSIVIEINWRQAAFSNIYFSSTRSQTPSRTGEYEAMAKLEVILQT